MIMSTLIRRQVVVLGLAIVLAAPAYSQADSSKAAGSGLAAGSAPAAGSGRHIHFTHVSLNNNNDGKHRSYSLRATDANGNTYRFRKSDDRVVEFEINDKPVSRDQYARYEEMFDDLATPPTPPVPPVAPVGPAAPAAPVAPVASGGLPLRRLRLPRLLWRVPSLRRPLLLCLLPRLLHRSRRGPTNISRESSMSSSTRESYPTILSLRFRWITRR